MRKLFFFIGRIGSFLLDAGFSVFAAEKFELDTM